MKRSGFTLIELLVVIAIIAILAAILFPVFAQAREAARTSTCLSNTKQMGTAMMMYVQDYDEQFPGWTWNWNCNGGNNGGPRDSAAFWTMAVYPYIKNIGIYECPDDQLQWNDAWSGADCSDDAGKHDMFAAIDPNTGKPCNFWDACNPKYVSYGFSEYLTNMRKYGGINAPAHELLFADTGGQLAASGPLGWWDGTPNGIVSRVAFANQGCCLIWNGNKYTAAEYLAGTAPNSAGVSSAQFDAWIRHHGGNNVTFADSHSKYIRWQSLTVCRLSSDPNCPGGAQ